jgi:hypothetical protein
MHVVFF